MISDRVVFNYCENIYETMPFNVTFVHCMKLLPDSHQLSTVGNIIALLHCWKLSYLASHLTRQKLAHTVFILYCYIWGAFSIAEENDNDISSSDHDADCKKIILCTAICESE